jgi:hypothetical protein
MLAANDNAKKEGKWTLVGRADGVIHRAGWPWWN